MAVGHATRVIQGPVLSRWLRFAFFAVVLFAHQTVGGQSGAEPPTATQPRSARTIALGNVKVTAVEGPSWLEHLQRPMFESSMGETGVWGPSPMQEQGAGPFLLSLPADFAERPLSMSGADLYRLSCRGCHGARGEGVPPEINSMIAPVQATSTELILERMKKSGAPISTAVARQLASQSQTLLLQRIHNGGVNMPAFPQLSPPEVQALVAYLDLLVGIPGAQNRQVKLEVPVAHVGEDLAKGTCHICHAATGLNPTPEQVLKGVVPPLAALPRRVDMRQFVQKVVAGRPIAMGTLDLQYRGRMPVFYYLKVEEAAAAYEYLNRDLSSELGQSHRDGTPSRASPNENSSARSAAHKLQK